MPLNVRMYYPKSDVSVIECVISSIYYDFVYFMVVDCFIITFFLYNVSPARRFEIITLPHSSLKG